MKNKLSYVGVKALIVHNDKVLIMQEPTWFDGGGKWELPGGKLSEGEERVPLETILLREVEEELGKDFKISIGNVVDVMRRPWNKPGSEADMVFLAVFVCTYLEGEVTLSKENNAHAWITKNELDSYTFIDGYLPVLKRYFEVV